VKKFDAIVIGSGHNALIAAAYLARAGWSVLVLEKNDRPGGLVRTDELTLHGFHHDVYSSAHPLFVTSQAYADLGAELTERGLRYLNTDTPTGVLLPDGRGAVFHRDLDATAAELDRFAAGDGDAYRRLIGDFGPHAQNLFPLFGMDLTSPAAKPFLKALMVNGAGDGPSPFASEFLRTAREVLSVFRSPLFPALAAPWTMHLGRTPDGANSGPWVPLTLMALMAGGMALPEGGSGKLADALAKLITDKGGDIRTHSRVEKIVVKNGKAVAVKTAQHEFLANRAVIASVNPDQLYLHLLADADVPAPLRQEAQNYRYGRGCIQVQLAVSEPPRFRDSRFDKVGQFHITGGLDACSLAIAQAMSGLLPAEPTISYDCPTNLDPSRAPQGKAIVRLQMLEIPVRPHGDAAGKIDVGDGTWTPDLERRFAERVIDIANHHAPNLKGSILEMHITSPRDLAQFNPNCGPGDPYGGSHDISQSYLFRPLPSQPSHRTAVPNLYMLGAATWPGHGVNGGSGYIVAQQLLHGGA
jgi:phytoene dehydrogenase-like protein